MSRLQYTTVYRLALRALAGGGSNKIRNDGTLSWRHVEWDIAGNCQNPIIREFHSRPSVNGQKRINVPKDGMPIMVTMTCTCRACENCLKRRAAHWRYRVKSEIGHAPRTWFGTLTFRPEAFTIALAKVRVAASKQGDNYDQFDDRKRFAKLSQEMGKDVTLFLKRLRKSGAVFNYLVVSEAHKSGVPHFHLLVHERPFNDDVKHAQLVRSWNQGFCKFNLLHDVRQGLYLTKYLTKSLLCRVRASKRYGDKTT